MPRVQIRQSVASADYAYTEGETVEVTGDRAAELVRHGFAELVRGEQPATPEGRAQRPETPEGGAPARRRRERRG